MLKTFKRILLVTTIAPLISSSTFICAMDSEKSKESDVPYKSHFAIQDRNGNFYFKNIADASNDLQRLKTFLQKHKIKTNQEYVERSQQWEKIAKKATNDGERLTHIADAYNTLLKAIKQDDLEPFYDEISQRFK